MILKSNSLVIKQVDSISKELEHQILLDEEIVNMTEVKQYPPNMPSQMVFEIFHEEKIVGELKFKTIKWFNRKVELSIFILKEYRKKGFGKEALLSAIEYAFNKMNFHRLEAEVIEYNDDSIRLLEGLGFKSEGRLREGKYRDGKYFDVLRYGLLKSEFEHKK